MTQATTRLPAVPGISAGSPTGSPATQDHREAGRPAMALSGWYDPDGAAWEAEVPSSPETSGRSSNRPPIRIEGVERDD